MQQLCSFTVCYSINHHSTSLRRDTCTRRQQTTLHFAQYTPLSSAEWCVSLSEMHQTLLPKIKRFKLDVVILSLTLLPSFSPVVKFAAKEANADVKNSNIYSPFVNTHIFEKLQYVKCYPPLSRHCQNIHWLSAHSAVLCSVDDEVFTLPKNDFSLLKHSYFYWEQYLACAKESRDCEMKDMLVFGVK